MIGRRGNPVLVRMGKDLETALASVIRCLEVLERSPDATTDPPYSVVPTAIRDLRALKQALVRVADPEQSPYVWNLVNPTPARRRARGAS